MQDVSTTEALLDLLRAGRPEDKLNVDTSTITYALYVRKSTTGEDRQERSIPDQIKECIDKVMTPAGIVPAKIFEEKFSAKEPDTRDHFKELISDIKAGRINGLIAWHPDRLARNMKDAGEIIDLLDKGVLRDLRFATSTFENNPTGKMLLGISFVLSKQYSEHLSESVTRGNRRATEEDGIFLGKFKHGYYIDTNRHLIPDSESFTLVQKMFQMRLEGLSQKDILGWINNQGYKLRKRGKDPQPYVWDKDEVSNLLRDPVYAGVLQYGNSTVDLTEKYDFSQMITVSDFTKINKLDSMDPSKLKAITRVKGGEIKANLLRGMVYCGDCSQPLTSNIVPKKDPANSSVIRSYYYYKCETPTCPMRNKGARANLVVDTARNFFKNYLFITKDNYDVYVANAKKELKRKNIQLDSDIASVKKRIGDRKSKYLQTKDLLIANPDLAEHYNLTELQSEESNLRLELAQLENRRTRSKETIATYKEYLKLLESTPVILGKLHNMEVMDEMLKMFFSNFTIRAKNNSFRQGSEVSYELKEPWAGFLKEGKFVSGAG